jgi:hypothetical protein
MLQGHKLVTLLNSVILQNAILMKVILLNTVVQNVVMVNDVIEQERIIIPSDEVKKIIRTNYFLIFFHTPKLAHKQLA